MSIIPLRALGKAGVITDADPFNLPVEALSFAKNVRCENGTVERGSVFRTVGALAQDPKHLIGYKDTSGNDHLLYVDQGGFLRSWVAGTEADLSASGWSSATSTASVTSCFSNNMIYVNRPDRVPWYRSKDGSGAFTTIPTGGTGWDLTHRCQALRSYAGVLMAFNITKGAQVYPNMVKWSDFTSYDAGPANWDAASTTSSAGENILAEMDGPMVDGLIIRNRMMIYGTKETWYAEYIGGNDMFRWDKAFGTGVINANCVVEQANLHYVFGQDDITVNDGLTSKSIADSRVRRFIFRTMKKSSAHLFFVTHNALQNEIIFCYVSEDPYIAFPSSVASGCNRAAIYNYAADTWYFADLPYVRHAINIVPQAGTTFDSTTTSYEALGGSFADLSGDTKSNLAFASVAGGSASRSLRTFEAYGSTSSIYPLDATANVGSYIERLGLDLDELKVPLRGYKLVSSVYPQCRLSNDSVAMRFNFGASDGTSEAPVWGTEQTYDRVFYKLDFNEAGRFLSYKIAQDDFTQFTLSGFDFDVTLLGQF